MAKTPKPPTKPVPPKANPKGYEVESHAYNWRQRSGLKRAK